MFLTVPLQHPPHILPPPFNTPRDFLRDGSVRIYEYLDKSDQCRLAQSHTVLHVHITEPNCPTFCVHVASNEKSRGKSSRLCALGERWGDQEIAVTDLYPADSVPHHEKLCQYSRTGSDGARLRHETVVLDETRQPAKFPGRILISEVTRL